MSENQIIPQRHFCRPVLLATAIFLTIGLTAGGAVWLWKANQGPVVLSERELNGLLNLHTTHGEDVKIERGLIEIQLAE